MTYHDPEEQTWDTLELERILVNDETHYLNYLRAGRANSTGRGMEIEFGYLCGENNLDRTAINWDYISQESRDQS